MDIELTTQQQDFQAEFREFTNNEVAPYAGKFDREEKISMELVRKLGEKKYLSAILPKELGGLGTDMVGFAILNEELGRGCSSVRSLLTVHSMVSYATYRWGNKFQKSHWLPKLATGEVIGAFALTEPDVGSNAKSIKTSAVKEGEGYVINGHKKWITFGQIADLFLIFGQMDEKHVAFLIEKDTPGLSIEPINGMLGTRGSMLSHVYLKDCKVPPEAMVGGVGFGISAVALSALDIGRYSVATGSVGIGQACVESSLAYANERKQFDVNIGDHQLVRRMLTNMIVKVKAARLMCFQAGCSYEKGNPLAGNDIIEAKYFASTMLNTVAPDAVQIHGGNGCSQDYPVERLYRDAKVMEIIEGSSQVLQLLIAKNAL